MALTIVLFSIASVCASDADDIAISNEDDGQIGLSTQIDNDETLTEENAPEALSADEGTYSDLRNEIGNGGNINLTRSYYQYTTGDGDSIKITSPGIIDGKGAVIDMAGAERIQAFLVSTDNVTIKNLTIKNVMFTFAWGGAIYFNGGNVTLTDCNFINNTASAGGAIFFDGCNATLENCIFTNNSANSEGAAVYLNCTNFTARKCIFINNNATGDGFDGGEGGAISVFAGDTFTYIDSCEFTNNTATPGDPSSDLCLSSAGAIDASGETVIINSRFNNNFASMGGAIWLTFGDSSKISNCNFTNNSALYSGAFLTEASNNVTIEGSTFDGNKATESSGAISNDAESILSIIGCIFTNNEAPDGCAIYNDIDAVGDMGQLTIADSTFTGNGGADDYSIYNEGNLTLSGNTVDNIIYNSGIITSTTNVIVLANKTFNVKFGEVLALNATFTDDNGNLIDDVNLYFTIAGVPDKIKSSYAAGVYTGTYKVNKAGQRAISVLLGYDACVNTATIIVDKINTQLSAKGITTTYNVAKNLVVTLKDANGDAVPNAKIIIKLNGKSTSVTTDKNGQAKLAIKLPANKYTATITFDGNSDYIKSAAITAKVVVNKASSKIVAKKKTFKAKTKTKKYAITLKDGKGKAIKKVKVTIKVGKKTFKAKTNSKGKATFKITKLTKTGKYKAKIKFAGNNNYKSAAKTIKYITIKK